MKPETAHSELDVVTRRQRRSAGVLAVVLLLAGLLAGCSSGSGVASGPSSSAVDSSAVNAAVWNPQTLPKSAAREMNLDTTFEPQCSPIPGAPEIKSCGWTSYPPGGDFAFNGIVFSMPWTMDKLRSQTNLHDFESTTVSGTPAVRFLVNKETYVDRCDVAYATSFGLIWATISSASLSQRIDTCKYVDRWAAIVKRNAPQ